MKSALIDQRDFPTRNFTITEGHGRHMEDVLKGETGALFLFLYLLPGFLGAVVYDYLVERATPSNFDRIVESLVLTLKSSLFAHICFNIPLLPNLALAKDTPLNNIISAFLSTSLVYISIISSIISFIIAYMNNHKIIYLFLNYTKVTYKSGEDDVWADTFYKHRKFWIRIIFQDNRSLVGWPKYYSATGKPRELFVASASWWEPDTNVGITSVEVPGEGVYICDFTKVISIEILER